MHSGKTMAPSISKNNAASFSIIGHFQEKSSKCLQNRSQKKCEMINLRQKIKNVLLEAQISEDYKGFPYLEYAICLVIQDESRLSSIFNEVYTKVGDRFGATPKAVERNIRTLRDAFWNNGGFEYFQKHCNVLLYNRPYARELIELFAEQVLQEIREERL